MDSVSVSRGATAPQYNSAKKRGDRSGDRSGGIAPRASGLAPWMRDPQGPYALSSEDQRWRLVPSRDPMFSGDPGSLERPKIPQPCKDSGQRQDVNSIGGLFKKAGRNVNGTASHP